MVRCTLPCKFTSWENRQVIVRGTGLEPAKITPYAP
ncbi:MAG: hypothetical protein UR17_C0001G0727 [Candidatus Woesebacteria bacterium GW2011_GWF1_31_35]|nr:MAG: hypothetical protein UR17_C0001G0727 [Candidatus Woesebacteria bacterium GW2011_GWF1_31_35]